MLTSELRAKFLDYFKKNDHEVVDSSPLIPVNDDTPVSYTHLTLPTNREV